MHRPVLTLGTSCSCPNAVVNFGTNLVLGYFVSASEFEEYLKVRDLLPEARFAWEMPSDIAEELEKPLNRRWPELDALMEE
jgi:hypothetical protein